MKNPSGLQCSFCNKIHYPAHARCLQCKHTKFSKVVLPSSGILITYTVLRSPSSQFRAPLCLGIIELTIGKQKVRYSGQLDAKPENLRLGMRVHSKWGELHEIDNQKIFGYLWEPYD